MTAAHATNGSFPKTARDAFGLYFDLGVRTIPNPHRSKNAGSLNGDWNELELTPDDCDSHFPPGVPRNIGARLGPVSRNLADVDLDCPQAVIAGRLLLPPTGWRFGRKSRPSSHYEYRVTGPCKTREYLGPDGKMVAELRFSGQTIYPPSDHDETGERVEWEQFDKLAELPGHELAAAAGRAAAAALLAKHWPDRGGRHHAAKHLAGGLLRAGWTTEQAERFMEAVCAAAGDDEVRDRVRAVASTAEKIEASEEVTGWPKLTEVLGDKVVSKVREWLGLRDTQPTEPIVIEEAPWPDPPAAEAFHGLAGRIVRAIEPASEADPAALLVQTLVHFGNIVGRSAYFQVEGDRHHGNEFVVLVGKTSKARKGTSWGRVHHIFRQAEEVWAAERVQSGLSSGEGLIWAVRDPIQKRERVKERGEPARYEEVEADPGVSDKRLLVYEPEYANVLKQTERHGNTISTVLRQAWDGLDLRTLTKNSPARASGAHISLVGHITTEELRRCLTGTEIANGFGNRNLWVCTDRSKLLPEGGRLDDDAVAALTRELAEVLEFAKTAGRVGFDVEARAVWWEVYGALSDGKPGLAGALLGRAEAHVMRLAMLYALSDRSAVITAPHLMAAMALWDYAQRSVYFIFGDCLGDPVADDLLRLLRANPNGLTRTDMMHYFARNQSAERIGRALGLLLQHKLARREEKKTGGRPSECWFAVRGGQGG